LRSALLDEDRDGALGRDGREVARARERAFDEAAALQALQDLVRLRALERGRLREVRYLARAQARQVRERAALLLSEPARGQAGHDVVDLHREATHSRTSYARRRPKSAVL